MTAPQSMAEELMAQLQGAPMQQMAQQLGASSQQIQSAVGAALPLLLGALGQNAAQPQGAAALFNALERDHGQAAPQGLGSLGGLGDLLGAVMGGAGTAPGRGAGGGLGDGAAILGQILGGNRQQAENQLGQATGLGSRAGQLLAMLAPMVMAYLANRVKAGNMDASALGQTRDRNMRDSRAAGCWAAC